MQQLFKTSSLFDIFIGRLKISGADDQILRDARRSVRAEIRRAFRERFPAYLQRQAGAFSSAQIAAARQFGGEKVKFLTQGSYRYNTLNKTQHTPPQQMDLDDGVYFMMSDLSQRHDANPNLLFGFIETILGPLAREKGWTMQTKPTCIRLEIARDKHIDVPLYIVPDREFQQFTESDSRAACYSPDVDSGQIWLADRGKGWVTSDPRQIIDWVIACHNQYGACYKKLCRVMKAWRDHWWTKSSLSSICIMRMVDMALKKIGRNTSAYELDVLLTDVIDIMHRYMGSNQAIFDPADASKRLDAQLSGEERQQISARLSELVSVMRNTLYSDNGQPEKNRQLRDQFGRYFPDDFSKISRCKAAAATAAAGTAGAAPVTTGAAPRPYAAETFSAADLPYRRLSAAEQSWLAENQPSLWVEGDKLIRGRLFFKAQRLAPDSRQLQIFQSAPPAPDASWIEDDYEISACLQHGNSMPQVRETEGKILAQLGKHGITKPATAHMYLDNRLCLGTKAELARKLAYNQELPHIVNEIIIPYLYYHSYWAKFGKEPWRGLAHGDAGVLQNYRENRNISPWDYLFSGQLSFIIACGIIHNFKMPRGGQCFCKKLKAKKCRCGAVEGYNLMRQQVTRLIAAKFPGNIVQGRLQLLKKLGEFPARFG